MKTSVAIATYNGEQYIVDLLESIKGQSRQVDEVIITDDCSTDSTVKIISNYIKDNNLSNWSIFVNDSNIRYAENFKGAVERTTGDIVFFCDQDDIWTNNRVEIMAKALENNPEIEVLNTNYATFLSGNENELKNYFEYKESKPIKIESSIKTRYLQYPGCVMCFRKSFYNREKGNWLINMAQDDFTWCFSIINDSCYYLKFCSLKRRIHDSQVSGNLGHSREKRIKYLESETLVNKKLLELSIEKAMPADKVNMYRRFYKMSGNRLNLVKNRKIYKVFSLLFDLKYYYSKKSFLVELLMSIRR